MTRSLPTRTPRREWLLVYGAAGFTGRLILEEARAYGLPCIAAGRSRNKLEALTASRGIPHRIADVDDAAALAAILQDVGVIINAAGPFSSTAPALARACIAAGAHYLDIAGEYRVIESLVDLDARARESGVVVMPAVGFDVVPSDCLAALVARRLPGATRLAIALRGLNAISRGSAESVAEQYQDLVVVRRNGRLARIAPGTETRRFDFGSGPVETTAVTWADVASAYRTTGIPNITVFYEATPIVRIGLTMSQYGGWLSRAPLSRWWRRAGMRALPAGPSAEERARGSADVIASVEDDAGRAAEARLRTPEVYSFTATTSVAAAERVLGGGCEPGFQTPARALGADFVLGLPGVTYVESQGRAASVA